MLCFVGTYKECKYASEVERYDTRMEVMLLFSQVLLLVDLGIF